MRHTKIVATVGPASSDPRTLLDLLRAGVDVFRLNFSHGTHESHANACRAIREAAAANGHVVGVMQDLSGPKIRTGSLEGDVPLELETGGTLRIAAGDRPGRQGLVYTQYTPLVESARPGDRLLLDDGRIELQVAEVRDGELVTAVVNGGSLGPRKGINAPGVSLPASAVTEKDERDLRFGLELGVDLVALSFVQTAGDVARALEIMRAAGRVVPVIAKIERPAGIDHLDAILDVAAGVMVARGDLGLEMPLEQIPRVQKHVIRQCRAAGRPVILATQVLESMRVEPRPTRAEVSDAANAVVEGADAIMLAGETAAGAFPVQAVQTLDAVIRDAELLLPTERVVPATDPTGSRHGRALCEAAVTLASTAQADAIVAVTREGITARMLASLRPQAPVIAATSNPDVVGRTTLLWGVRPVLVPASQLAAPAARTDAGELERFLVDRQVLPSGAVVVFVNVSAELNRTDANFVNLQRIA
jgi:pyruvate kinase